MPLPPMGQKARTRNASTPTRNLLYGHALRAGRIAAQMLNISQPALSQIVNHAEVQLGFKLITRVRGSGSEAGSRRTLSRFGTLVCRGSSTEAAHDGHAPFW
ncbi:LysR family transcriptional regulator [Rhizobium sp. CG5]|uniref:helix-turn-helix domain-containing protein n=1 Tax=Rhizobium sp. CG5 TaxID=2726076 RepID=UPI002033784A|nr:LysR family transcriptional regulator [Rhizobium sp. CG5]